MSRKVTLGGERLGSGNKLKIDLHGFERSTFDQSYIWRSTMSAGTLVPFLNEIALPGTTLDIHLNCDIKTHPTLGPLFGSYKVQLDIFSIPFRLYNSATHNNKLNIGNYMYTIKFPKIELKSTLIDLSYQTQDIENSQINPSCLLSYLGIRGVGNAENVADLAIPRKFLANGFLAYWDIFKNYYANKQEDNAFVISSLQDMNPVQNVTTVDIGTTGGTFTSIPQLPAPPAAQPLGANSQILINSTGVGGNPSPALIILYTSNFPNGISAQDLAIGPILDLGGGQLLITYNFGRLGNDQAYTWDYQRLPIS